MRNSAHTLDPTRLLSRTFKGRGNQGLFSKKHPEATSEQEQQLQGQDVEEFELVNREDLPIHLDDDPQARPNPEPPESTGETFNKPSSDPSTPPKQPAPSRTKSALYRLKNLSKASLHLSAFNSGRQPVQSNRAAEVSDIYLAFPRPPTHIPTPIASAYATSSLTSSTLVTANQELDETCSTLRVSPPFTNQFNLRSPPLVDSPSEFDAHPELSSTPTQTSGPFTSATTLDFDVRNSRKYTGSLKRLRSLSRLLHGPFNSRISDVSSGNTIRSRRRASSKATSLSLSVQSAFTEPLHSSPSNFAIEPAAENSSNPSEAALVVLARKAATTGESSSPAPLPIPPPASDALHPEQVAKSFSPVIRHSCVDPSEFTASPSPFATNSLLSPSSRTSFIPPSPSWLSRNVQNRDLFDYRTIFPPSRISLLTDSEHLKVPEISTYFTSALFAPDSPRPLPVPIPFLPVPAPQHFYAPESPYKPVHQRVVTDIYLETPEVDRDSLATPRSIAESSSSTSSIISSSAFVSAQPSPSTVFYHRLSTISRVSAERHRQSIAARKTRLNSPGSRRLSSKENRQSLNPLFKELSQSSSSRKHFSPSSNTLNLSVPTSLSPLPSENSLNLHAIFTPSSQAQDPVPLDSIPLPRDLATLLETLRLETSPPPNRRIMDYTAKNAEHVDFGGEVDYSGHQWFQEPPPRPEPQPVVEPYIPEQSVIMQNEAFGFALGAAPNVLYGRYKQYGQLGVLAWCSEFGELIDSLKELGFRGNMFVTTRTQALRTCEEILKLKLDIEMQIILMYLSSQVARLRRFLDGERQWDDYPAPKFPLDYRQYGPS